MDKNNDKVPVAILSCFLIAFILQGVLKISGILIFEKALDWGIFKIIDNNVIYNYIYYSVLMCVAVYCMSFALTDRPYSKKWYHYFIIVICSFGVIAIRTFLTYTITQNILLDIFIYVLVPLAVNFTTDKKNRLFNNNIFEFVLTMSIQIGIYFLYLGLSFWSNILNSILPIDTMWLLSSAMTLIELEVYFGLIIFMLSMNMLIKKIRRVNNMNMPLNIASDEAKIKELEEKENKSK